MYLTRTPQVQVQRDAIGHGTGQLKARSENTVGCKAQRAYLLLQVRCQSFIGGDDDAAAGRKYVHELLSIFYQRTKETSFMAKDRIEPPTSMINFPDSSIPVSL